MSTAASVRHHGRPWLSVGAAMMALSAYGGAMALATVGIGSELEQRLPFASPVLGAVALLAVVAAPFTLVAWSAWFDAPDTGRLASQAGAVLVLWIAAELAFLREVSFLHPLCALAGALFVIAGRRAPA